MSTSTTDRRLVGADAATRELFESLLRLTRVIKSERFRPPTTVPLTRAEVGVLRWLEQHGETRGGDLACAFGLSPSVISRQLNSLEHRGLVHRRTDPADARAGLISLTDTGRSNLDEITAQYVARLAAIVEDWDEPKRRKAARMVAHLADRLAESHDTTRKEPA